MKVSAGTGNFRLVPKFSLQSITDSGLRGSGLGSWTLESMCVYIEGYDMWHDGVSGRCIRVLVTDWQNWQKVSILSEIG